MPRDVARIPQAADVERIAREEAARAGITFEQILGAEKRQSFAIMRARQVAFARIVQETGCSGRGLAKAWGFTQRQVHKALKGSFGVYDAPTVARLTWQYGDERAAAIIAGKDWRTSRGRNLWTNLGQRSAA